MVNPLEESVATLLGRFGYKVDRVLEGESKTPDFVATNETEELVVEVKTKEDDVDRPSEMGEAFKQGELYEEHLTMGRRNRVSAIVEHGVDQLSSFASPDSIRVLWFFGVGQRTKVYRSQIRQTLLGESRIYDVTDTTFGRDCYFFYNSGFYRWRSELDGAVVSGANSGQLCINPYSPRADRLRRSVLASKFGPGVLDPEERERQGLAILADCSADRSNSAEVLAYLQEKTGRPTLMNIDMGYQAIWSAVDIPTED